MLQITSDYLRVVKPIIYSKSKLVWKDSIGVKRPLHMLDTNHLNNLLKCFTGESKHRNFINSHYYKVKREIWIESIQNEIKRRNQ